ncbi:hypothetical protein GWI33_001757 [Rhynchophorus ferrugineus]|uniref:Uncharacterized protein n=1 Tax=Rhynchophorus ferrugineus TaxID=354439 RepID=A0A834IL43_RHYFE|nr:hypothetical protein GWI33_001757 [Rhynchophorus ferrugineus]
MPKIDVPLYKIQKYHANRLRARRQDVLGPQVDTQPSPQQNFISVHVYRDLTCSAASGNSCDLFIPGAYFSPDRTKSVIKGPPCQAGRFFTGDLVAPAGIIDSPVAVAAATTLAAPGLQSGQNGGPAAAAPPRPTPPPPPPPAPNPLTAFATNYLDNQLTAGD